MHALCHMSRLREGWNLYLFGWRGSESGWRTETCQDAFFDLEIHAQSHKKPPLAGICIKPTSISTLGTSHESAARIHPPLLAEGD